MKRWAEGEEAPEEGQEEEAQEDDDEEGDEEEKEKEKKKEKKKKKKVDPDPGDKWSPLMGVSSRSRGILMSDIFHHHSSLRVN